VVEALRGAEPQEDAAHAPASAALAHGRRFRFAFTSGVGANMVCFERELLDHSRLVFEKKPSPSG
jgi:hypothetical protein